MISLPGLMVVDAVDTVTAKLDIVVQAQKAGVPVISCMGTGNKLNASRLTVTDIYKTSVCPLAKVMRRELKKRGVKKLKVVYSTEEPIKTGSRTPGSVAFVPLCGRTHCRGRGGLGSHRGNTGKRAKSRKRRGGRKEDAGK